MINKIFLLFTALMYGWLGGWALFDPASYVDDVGLSMTSNLGSAEIRSVYGGINFLVGLSALYALLKTVTGTLDDISGLSILEPVTTTSS